MFDVESAVRERAAIAGGAVFVATAHLQSEGSRIYALDPA
ncbi:MAG: PQQ-binding-like beta-propeller repeat protein [Haloarculaceae archaeon]